MINEVIEEEDEYKNNINKENETQKGYINNNNEKNKQINDNIINKNKLSNNNIDIKNYLYNENNKNKRNLIWCNSPLNKKINTLENISSKKPFDELIPIRDKLFKDNKNNQGIILPDLNKIKNSDNILNNFKSLNLKNSFNPKKVNLRSISIDKTKFHQNLNINSITNDTSAFTQSSKKYYSPMGLRNQNYTEDLSKFRLGLLSAGSTSNNNIIIPIIPLSRPVSNFNFGGGQLLNHFENNNINKNIINKNVIKNEDKNNIIKINYNLKNEEDENKLEIEFNKKGLNMNNIYSKPHNETRNKLVRSQNIKDHYKDMKNDMNNYLDMDKILGRLHKIKIEKGMMNSSIVNSLNKKLNSDYRNQIELFKKSHLPRMFNIQNNNKISRTMDLNMNNSLKNDSKRSLSFNNKKNNH